MEPWTPGPGVVALPGGCLVRGRALRNRAPDGPAPAFAVYLVGHEPGPFDWEHRWVRCPDFRTPTDTADAIGVLEEAFERSAHERIEVGCGGGIGRTGLGLAVMAVLAGVPATQAVTWVRANYHPRAVETPWQRRWVRRLDARP